MAEQNRSYNGSDQEMEIDLREIVEVLKKWSKMIIAGTLLCVFTAAILSYFVLNPLYESKSLIMVTKTSERVGTTPTNPEGIEGVVSSVSQLPVLTMNTYIGQLKSQTLRDRVITKMKKEDKLPANIGAEIDATIIKDTNLIEVSVKSGDPYVAAEMANLLTAEYVDFMTEKNQEQMNRSVSFLEKQKQKTDEELQVAIQALKEYESRPKGVAVLDLEFESKSQDVTDFNSRLQTCQVEIQQLSSGLRELEIALTITPDTITVQKWDQYSQANVSTQEPNQVYVAMAQQYNEKKASLAEKVGEMEGLHLLIESMNSDLNSIQAELVEKRVEQERLQRDVERLKQTSETLAQKTTETQIARSIDLGDTSVSVVSAASVPYSPIKPNKQLNIAIAFLLGLMIFSLAAFLIETLDNTIKTPEDINRELGLPVLGVVPLATEKNIRRSAYFGGHDEKEQKQKK